MWFQQLSLSSWYIELPYTIYWILLPLVGYAVVTALYRLYFSPASRFPGPKLAALTFFYEGYYDVWRPCQYTWKIKELHEKYGPFVRINPQEIHCDDPEFFDVLYVSAAKRRTDKWSWAARQSWTRNSTFKTIEHDLHKERRNQISSFFSKSSIRSLEPLISNKVGLLCNRIENASRTGSIVNMTHASVALTLDIASRICFGFSYNCLERDEFAREWYEVMVSTSATGHLIRQFPGLFYLLNRFPQVGSKSTSEAMVAFERKRQELIRTVNTIVDLHARGEKPPSDGFTIFHEMLNADVSSAENSPERLVEEAQSLMGAGSMTTATVLDTTIYHLLSNPRLLDRLLEELSSVMPNQDVIPNVSELEKLPFLTAIIHEGLRLGKGVSYRLARVSPDKSYNYHDVVIPRGVPVGMTALHVLENPTIFPDPHNFVPERWMPMDAPEVRRRRKALVVFGGGSRMCLGLNLAWAELYLTIAMLFSRLGRRMTLHEVEFDRDMKITRDGFNALPSVDSKGLRISIH